MTQWLHTMNTEACCKLFEAITLLYKTPSPIVLPHHNREFGYSMIHAIPINKSPNKNTVSIPMNPTPSTINPTSFTSTDVSNGCVVSNDESTTSGVMQACRETTKTDSVKYNQCQACSESYPFD